jgi:hypothetical protein
MLIPYFNTKMKILIACGAPGYTINEAPQKLEMAQFDHHRLE